MNYNKSIQGCRILRDPELKYTKEGTAICIIDAVNDSGYGENKRPHFFRAKAFGKTAEVIAEHHKKGDPIFLEGRQETDQWVDKQGNKKSKTVMMVEKFTFVGSKSDRGQGQQPSSSGSRYGSSQKPTPDPEPESGRPFTDNDSGDDDVPF